MLFLFKMLLFSTKPANALIFKNIVESKDNNCLLIVAKKIICKYI